MASSNRAVVQSNSPLNSIHDFSESDSEDDRIRLGANDSIELAEHDRQLLHDEDERENFLIKGISKERSKNLGYEASTSIEASRDWRRGGRLPHKSRRRKDDGTADEQGHLMYEMEEGGPKEDISSSASSSSAELNKIQLGKARTTKKDRFLRYFAIAASIGFLFCLLVYGAYKASQPSRQRVELRILSNGTSDFAPTTILISLDGFRADFLQRGLTPTLNSFVAEGVSPKFMLPSFPSVTFPNHYTLVTGLYPESHGVVGNSFWDPDFEEDFFYTDPSRSMQPKWWAAGEPLWVTAEKQNVTTAVHMWPGSEAHIARLEPTFLDKFNGTEDLTKKVHRILELIDTPGPNLGPAVASRPQLIAAYVPVVDADGHLYGPNSTEIRKTIKHVDSMLYDLFAGLEQRNLTKIVNIVVVSDHGMATTSTERVIQLDDLIDLNLIERMDGWPLYGLRPKNPIDLRGLYDRLLVEADKYGHFDVYLKETMPKRYHFSKNDRIAPLWVIPKTGWAIAHKEDFDVERAKAAGKVYHPKGLHGYDHEHPLMRSIFIARGPAFPHQPNSRLEIFQNIEVYNIVCDSLGIEPRPNNGSLRLPLKPVGLHSDHPATSPEVPEDLPSDADMITALNSPNASQAVASATPTGKDSNEHEAQTTDQEANAYWAFIKAKFEAAKIWADSVIASLGDS